MSSRVTEHLLGCLDFAAAIAEIPFVHHIEKRSKLAAPLIIAVYTVGNGDKVDIPLPKYDLGVVADFKIITTDTAHILDIMMPYVDGITVLKTVRKNNNHVPILLLTAKHQIEDKVEGLDAGANDYLTKPFDFRELLARLRCIMRIPEVQNSNTIRIGNVTLDDVTCVLSTPLGSYQLANKEFQMMKLFMTSPGQIISADRFLEKIWDMDSNAEMNTVWTYVSYLRRKLEAISANVQITTKRNLGYALEEIK